MRMWSALLAVLLQAAWPLASLATLRAPNALQPVCSADRDARHDSQGNAVHKHCKMCAQSSERHCLAATGASAIRVDADRSHERHFVREDSPLSIRGDMFSRPRAPPVS